LDTFPFNGITTTCDALWMGVPTVSLCGRTHVSRAGASLLSAVGLACREPAELGALACAAPDDYVRAAVRLASDRDALAALRSELRGRMNRSPLRDEAGFARRMEAAYRHMWRA
jgi:predicted O-linked N-acetylglucosamine transferase (SPINDLY family)